MKKTIKTMQGKNLDFDELALRNEKVTAVGNMNVNAAGESILNSNKDRANKHRRGKKTFRRQIQKRVFDMPIMESKHDAIKHATQMAEEYAKSTEAIKEAPEEFFDEADALMGKAVIQTAPPSPKVAQPNIVEAEVSDELLEAVLNKSTKGGLAGAIAKAKDVKHGPIKSPREQLRASDGVKKI